MRLFAFVLLALLSASANAVDRYVRAGATGTATGADWTNAYTALPTTLNRGDTYYIATGSYAGRTFNTAASGTQVITIKGATAADHGTNTGWLSSYGVDVTQATWTSGVTFSTSYWVFDGVVGPTWSKTPSQYGFAFNAMQFPVQVFNLSIAINDITIAHVAATAPAGDVQKFFLSTDNSTKAVSNVTISHSYLDGWQNAVWATSPGLTMDNWITEYTVMLNGYSSAGNHGEWINNNFGFMTNRITRYNLFESGGNGMSGVVVANNNNTLNDQIYGNVVKDMTVSNCIFGSASSGMNMQNAKIYNNTIINTVTSGGVSGPYPHTGTVFYNNLIYNMSGDLGSGNWTHDYNYYVSTTNTPTETNRQTGTGSPFVNLAGGDLHLSAASNNGTSLSAPYNVDIDGITRGADGVWDRGAFEFVSAAAPVVSALTCNQTTVNSPMGSTLCTATASNTPTSYTWSVSNCTTANCKQTGTTNPATYTCSCGGNCTICVTATNANGTSPQFCTAAGYLKSRYRTGSGLRAR